MKGSRRANSVDRISSAAILTAGLVGGALVFVVALPLALSSPFPTPKQSEWIIQSSSFDGAPGMQPPPLVPPPMEALPAGALQVEPLQAEQLNAEQPEIATGALAAQPTAAEPAP